MHSPGVSFGEKWKIRIWAIILWKSENQIRIDYGVEKWKSRIGAIISEKMKNENWSNEKEKWKIRIGAIILGTSEKSELERLFEGKVKNQIRIDYLMEKLKINFSLVNLIVRK